MTRPHKIFVVLLGLGVVFLWRPLFEPVATGKDPDPVMVVNTPLPVTLQGTGQISGNVNVAGSVNIANDVSAPVPVENVAAGPLTHIGRLPTQHVVLRYVSQGSFFRSFPDGGVGAEPFTIPDGSVLVVTDIDWMTQNGTPGNTEVIDFVTASTGFCYHSTALIASDGLAGRNDHMTSGFVLTKLPDVFSTTFLRVLLLRGYLAPKVVRQ